MPQKAKVLVPWTLITVVTLAILLQLPIVLPAPQARAATHSVSNATQLQNALNSAQPGDEIVLNNGVYQGPFSITGANGTQASPITIRAANPRQAMIRGYDDCNGIQAALDIYRNHWTIKDLIIENTERAIYMDGVTGINFTNNIIQNFHADGIAIYNGANGNIIQNNVIGHGNACYDWTDAAGIFSYRSSNNTYRNNIIVATGNNGYQYYDKHGSGMILNGLNNTVQGNLLLQNAGKTVSRVFGDDTSGPSNNNIIRDNAFLFGEGGGTSSDDYDDDSNQFINNIIYGNYYWQWATKGNIDGNRGHHTLQHNLMYEDDFSRAGMGFIYGGYGSGESKFNNIFKDNLLYSNGPQDGGIHNRILLTIHANQSQVLSQNDHNLFWASGSASTWNYNYSYAPTDIHGPQPNFVNPAAGDFSLAAGSPGKGAASDGKDIGIEYNSFLKKTWLQNAFTLPTQQKNNLTTNTSFSVSPNHYYQVWFYIPNNAQGGSETFNVEGQSLGRDIGGLTTGADWIQPGGPARWITLGRHKATDGTLNISWGNSGSAERIFIRQIPTTDEAYSWIAGAGSSNPTVSLQAAPTSITPGGSSTLTWSSTNVTSCTASGGWSGTKATSGTQSVAPTVTTTYTLSCSGSAGSASQSATVTVGTSSGPALSATPTTVTPGGTATVQVSNSPGNIGEWVGLYSASAPAEDGTWTNLLDWKYLSNTQGYPSTPQTSATLTFAMPQTQGSYEFRLFYNDSFTLLAESNAVSVSTAPATLQGDLNSDGTVNSLDWGIMNAAWFTNNATADINADGIVNSIDFGLMNANWGRSG